LLATRGNRGPGSAKRHEECRIAPGTRGRSSLPGLTRHPSSPLSCAGLTRASIYFARVFRRVMDTRVKPAYDVACVAASCSISDSNFKQPNFRILAAHCVRGLLFPSRSTRGDGAVGGARMLARHPWRRVVNPPRTARQPCAPKARRSASQRSTNHQAVDPSGAPRSGQLSLCPLKGSLLESDPSSNRTRAG
jgi:hypothetical protein